MQSAEFIQFNPVQLSANPPVETDALRAACTTLAAHGLLAPYENTDLIGSNGNVSLRRDPGLVITGTQLPDKHHLAPSDCVHVETCAGGDTRYHGNRLPSSESILHWHLLETFPDIHAVVHVHEFNDRLYPPAHRARWAELGIVETEQDVGGGTLEVGQATAAAFTHESLYVILRNHRPEWDPHRTGTVTLGRTLDQAVERALEIHQALAP